MLHVTFFPWVGIGTWHWNRAAKTIEKPIGGIERASKHSETTIHPISSGTLRYRSSSDSCWLYLSLPGVLIETIMGTWLVARPTMEWKRGSVGKPFDMLSVNHLIDAAFIGHNVKIEHLFEFYMFLFHCATFTVQYSPSYSIRCSGMIGITDMYSLFWDLSEVSRIKLGDLQWSSICIHIRGPSHNRSM